MFSWEIQFLFSDQYPFAAHIRWYGGYIDDLLLVEMAAGQFMDYINNNALNLKFTFEFQKYVIHFLDTSCIGSKEQGVSVAPFRNPTAGNATSWASSCHPPHVVKNIPVGELARIKRYSTCFQVYQKKKKKNTCCWLEKRGYPQWVLERAEKIVNDIPHKNLLE